MKIHSTSAWRRLSGQCYRRDKAKNAECAICHRPIDYDAKPSSYDWAYEPDHRLNAKDHPELALEPSNIQPAHRTCNRRKQGKAGITNLGKPSRKW